MWLDVGQDTQLKRKGYRKAVNKRLEMAYYKQLYEWCHKHNIALVGHPESSDDIGVLKYFHIPGQDLVWRWVAPEDGKALKGCIAPRPNALLMQPDIWAGEEIPMSALMLRTQWK